MLRTRIIVRTLLLGLLFTTIPQITATASPNIPDPNRTGSLTINKRYLPRDRGLKFNGMPQAINPAVNPPIPGVEFTISKVVSFDPGDGSPPKGFDLLSIASWQAAGELTPPQALSDSTTLAAVPGGSKRTDALGQVHFPDLPIGLYLVRETDLPADFDHDGDPATPAQSVLPAAPFLVTIPITNPVNVDGAAAGTTWLYDVFVYPKSSVATLQKTSDFADLALGTKVNDTITYTLTADIPERVRDVFGKEVVFERFEIVDELDPRLRLIPGSVRVLVTELPAIQIEEGKHYDVSITDHRLQVVFLESGLTQLSGALEGQQVQVMFEAEVTKMGEIPNGGSGAGTNTSSTLTIRTGQKPDTSDPRVPSSAEVAVHSPEIEVRFGGESIWKYGTDNPNVGLPGAVFRVFGSRDEALAYAADPVTNRATPLKFFTSPKPAKVDNINFGNPVEAATTDNDGRAIIAGLRYGDYWVLEVTAPSLGGVQYQLLAEPFQITIDSQIDDERGGALPDDTLVANVPQNAGFQLPITGRDRTLLPIVLGILSLGITVALMLEAQRRRRSV